MRIEEVSSSSQSVELLEHNEGNIENESEKTSNVKEKVEDPKVGMLFDSIDELVEFYKLYGKAKGFGVSIRTSKKGTDGKVRYVTVACCHTRKQRIRSSNPLKLKKQSKIDCKAKLSVVLCPDEKWMLNSMILDHNHELSPGKSRFYRCHKVPQSSRKMRLELSDKISILNNSFNSFGVDAGEHQNLPFLENDCIHLVNRVKCLQLREGDATTMNNYFLKMQVDNSNFFYMMDLDEEEFSDVVTFDTTYSVNKYDMPLALFVGMNHHGQLTLLGCALISSEDTETFTWLFQSWLTCMSGCPPSAIITDQDQAMKKDIEIVFPNARHRWCLWHIMKKILEKLRGCGQYESVKFCMQNVVYDSLTKEEFEESWGRFIEKYKIERNEWLLGLYDERHRWVPAFVKDIFWAGMSTTQRSESMHAFFEGYVNSKTSLKQFLEQYENALTKKVGDENKEEFNSFKSCLLCITRYEMEKQFQKDDLSSTRQVHLKRWSKTVKRSHTKIRICYDNWFVKPEARRFDKMCNAFHEVADLATDTEDRCEMVMTWIHKLNGELKEAEDVCGTNKPISGGLEGKVKIISGGTSGIRASTVFLAAKINASSVIAVSDSVHILFATPKPGRRVFVATNTKPGNAVDRIQKAAMSNELIAINPFKLDYSLCSSFLEKGKTIIFTTFLVYSFMATNWNIARKTYDFKCLYAREPRDQ
ncbi:unnamed protein product [Camellia sinensis]